MLRKIEIFGKACIHITTLEKFIGESGNYFVLEFPENYGTPAKVEMSVKKSITAYPVDITREIKELKKGV